MRNDSLLISVLMTAYNREKYIAEAIKSILDQTYLNFELIIVDDCSTDNTVQIAQNFQNCDNRVKVYKNQINLGDYPNRNKAVSYASGDIILFCDSDDTYYSDGLQYIVDSFNAYPHVQHSSIYYISKYNSFIMESEDAIRSHFFKNNILSCGPSARAFRIQFYKQMGGYPQLYGPANDTYFNIYTTSIAPILLLPYNYLNYRKHDGQEQNNSFAYLYHGYNYLNDLLMLPNLPLNSSEKYILYLGNKRRFILNSVRFLFKKKSFLLFFLAIKKANFGIKDVFFSIGFSSHFIRR